MYCNGLFYRFSGSIRMAPKAPGASVSSSANPTERASSEEQETFVSRESSGVNSGKYWFHF